MGVGGMSNTVYDKFFWADWENDPALKLCSLAAQGLWMRMLCVCAKADPKGYLVVAGRPLSPADLASIVGKSEPEVRTLLVELESNGVFSRDRKQRIYNRRMLRAIKKSRTNTENGSLGGQVSRDKQKGIFASPAKSLERLPEPHIPLTTNQEKKDAADAASVSSNQEVDLFRRGKELLGQSSGGLIRNLLAAKAGNVSLARAALETASTKQDPREYIGAIVRGNGAKGREYGVDYW